MNFYISAKNQYRFNENPLERSYSLKSANQNSFPVQPERQNQNPYRQRSMSQTSHFQHQDQQSTKAIANYFTEINREQEGQLNDNFSGY